MKVFPLALLALMGCARKEVVTLKPGWYTIAIYDEKDNLVVKSKLGEPVMSSITVEGVARAIYPLRRIEELGKESK